MPDRQRYAKHDPPNVLDHILAHPAGVTLAVWCVFIGAWLLYLPNKLPTVLATIMAVMFIVGGLFVLLGLLWFGNSLTTAWTFERGGWIFIASGWAGYFVSAFYFGPFSVAGLSIGVVVVIIAILRIIALYSIERRTRTTIALADLLDSEGLHD